jgi:hypothetical protein
MNNPPNTATQPDWKLLVERLVSSIESANSVRRLPQYVHKTCCDAKEALAAMQVPGPIPVGVRQPSLSDCAPWHSTDPEEMIEAGDLWCWWAILDPWQHEASTWTWHQACIAWGEKNGASHWLPHWAIQAPDAAEVPPLFSPALPK